MDPTTAAMAAAVYGAYNGAVASNGIFHDGHHQQNNEVSYHDYKTDLLILPFSQKNRWMIFHAHSFFFLDKLLGCFFAHFLIHVLF